MPNNIRLTIDLRRIAAALNQIENDLQFDANSLLLQTATSRWDVNYAPEARPSRQQP
jgi:hypothetical protein